MEEADQHKHIFAKMRLKDRYCLRGFFFLWNPVY